MSTTTIKAVWPGEKVETLQELKNSFGAAFVVWDEIAMRYLGAEPYGFMSLREKLWPVWKREDMPQHHKAVMIMTYDNALVMRENYAQAAVDIRAYLKDFPAKGGNVNHWDAIATMFESVPDCPAVGFWMTSTSEDPFEGEWSDELDAAGPLDWTKFWGVYCDKITGLQPATA